MALFAAENIMAGRTTETNQEIIQLITAAFTADGYLTKGNKARQVQALKLISMLPSDEYTTVNGFDTRDALLIIAYPNKTI